MTNKENQMIDYSFIEKLEGNTCIGYVPDPENSQSCVTIACGFDIGQRSENELLEEFSAALVAKLVPYVGLKKYDAQEKLSEIPLQVSEQESAEIHRYCKSDATKKLERLWNNSTATISFELLSVECQTVVASVAFQYGDLSLRTPNFWQQVTTENWQAALANLQNFGDKYPTRRNKEADLLAQWLGI
jgi:hypothetical protein